MNIFVAIIAFLSIPALVWAQSPTIRPREVRQEAKATIREVRQEAKTTIKAERQNIRSSRPRVQDRMLQNLRVTSISNATITAEKEGISYTVVTGEFERCTTVFRRRFGGESSIAEMGTGDIIHVVGYFTNESRTSMEACVIRNQSIQKRYGVFVGSIESVSDEGFTMTTLSERRPNQTVNLSSTTKIVNRRGVAIRPDALAVGHRVRVSGVWNNQNNTISEVRLVKDFSLPARTE